MNVSSLTKKKKNKIKRTMQFQGLLLDHSSAAVRKGRECVLLFARFMLASGSLGTFQPSDFTVTTVVCTFACVYISVCGGCA